MRAMYFFAPLVLAVSGIALGQNAPVTPTTTVTAPAPAADATLQNTVPIQVHSPSAVVGAGDILTRPQPKVGGALARAARARQPWQAINPFAPAEFGRGYENVTEDPHTRQPTGIVLVSFGSRRRH